MLDLSTKNNVLDTLSFLQDNTDMASTVKPTILLVFDMKEL